MAAPSLTVRNKRPRPLTFHVPELGMVSHEVTTTERGGKPGAVTGTRVIQQKLPTTLTLWARGTPGHTVTGLPPEAATSPELVAAQRRGDIELTVEGAVPTPEGPTAGPAEAAPAVEASPPEPAPAAPEKPVERKGRGGAAAKE